MCPNFYTDPYDAELDAYEFLENTSGEIGGSCRFCKSNNVEFMKELDADCCFDCGRVQ